MIDNLHNIDSIIFDMDGTLWDATESYARIWNETCQSFGLESTFRSSDLLPLMGMSIESIMHRLLRNLLPVDKFTFLKMLAHKEAMLMPQLGGVLFPGVSEGLEALHGHYRLFMLSNCSATGLVNFVNYTATSHLFEGLLTQGERRASKSENLRYLAQLYSLKAPVYVGDTQADCDQAHEADMPFFFATWGFGSCNGADMTFDSFNDLVNSFLKLHCH